MDAALFTVVVVYYYWPKRALEKAEKLQEVLSLVAQWVSRPKAGVPNNPTPSTFKIDQTKSAAQQLPTTAPNYTTRLQTPYTPRAEAVP